MDTTSIMLVILVAGGLTAILTFISFRQKQSSWTGTVVDKFHQEAEINEDGSTPERFNITFKTDEGKKVTLSLFQNDYDKFRIGDRALKKSGEFFPTKIS